MILNKPKRLIGVINGYEIGVESRNPDEDAATFDTFCDFFKNEITTKILKKQEEKVAPAMANEGVS